MSELLVLIDHAEGDLRKVSTQLLTKARELAGATSGMVAAVALGPGASGVADQAGTYGADKLYVWDDAAATDHVTLPMVEALQMAFDGSDAERMLFPSSDFYKDVAARLAIRLDAGIITDASGLDLQDGDLIVTKDVFGGQTITTSHVRSGHKAFVGVKPNAFAAEQSGGDTPELVELTVQLSEDATKSKVVDRVHQAAGDRPDIAEAAIVVAGGRGLGEESGFELMGELADVLGAGLGASRAAADAGWIPHRHQIGQTGKTISPQLYIGAGISGAIQHRAGMQTAQLIVAINKDPEAPIFNISDFGVVGDLYDVVPALIEEIRKRKG
ncbi:MAG: electron transfer flavoprotein subunit alpha/FixB family protein [Actinobacteria bacterium]|nr:electron transfer flavoprotein subunit alpha/FixB family protein [Actinomycetota bacterium]